MSFTVAEISRHVQGTVHGDNQFNVEQLKSLATAGAKDISFVNAEKYLAQAQQCNAGVLIIKKEWLAQFESDFILIVVGSPNWLFLLPMLKLATIASFIPIALLIHKQRLGIPPISNRMCLYFLKS